jgi:penicillin-binding protein 1A
MNPPLPPVPDPAARSSFKARLIARFDRCLSRPAVGRRLTRLGRIGGVMAALLLAYLGFLIVTTPTIGDLRQARVAQPTQLLGIDGKLLDSFAQQQRERVTLEQISPHVIDALIATEDHRFYQHHGVDFRGTAAAIVHTARGDTQGGSTITQQLARNLFPDEIGRARNINRKVKEIVTAFNLERTYSKREILETYLNTVPFLYNVFGIELAARTYFDKSAAELNLLESATLVGMLKGTSYYNPVQNPERAQKRRNVVLAQMVKHGKLKPAEYKKLQGKPLRVHFSRQLGPAGSAGHFVAWTRKWLIEWADRHDYDLYTDGLTVQTTLDPALQEAATQAVARQMAALQNIADVEWGVNGAGLISSAPATYAAMRQRIEPFKVFWKTHPELADAFIRETPEFKKARDGGQSEAQVLAALKSDRDFIARLHAMKTRLESGFVALDPESGEIRAWVGSRDYQRDQFDHVAQAERQPGSTFKPIVYGAALEKGLSPERMYQDTPMKIVAADGSVWQPTDMSGSSGGPMSLRQGLVYSKNTITAQVMQDVGLPAIIRLARALGVNQSKLEAVPSLALGTSPVTLLEMVSAYASIADQGQYRQPVFIRSITDRKGRVLAQFSSEPKRAMSAAGAIELTDIMRGVISQGTGASVRARFGLQADLAGKTGTTQNNTDGWFIMMHPNLVAGSWVGFNDARVTLRSSYWGQGGHNAGLLVGDFFRSALKGKMIDVKARFASPRGPAVTAPAPAEPELEPPEWTEPAEGEPTTLDAVDAVDAADPAQGAMQPKRPNDDGMPAAPEQRRVQSQSTADSAASRNEDTLARALRAMGRDPVTGAAPEPAAPQ